jgi:hypothetical protein
MRIAARSTTLHQRSARTTVAIAAAASRQARRLAAIEDDERLAGVERVIPTAKKNKPLNAKQNRISSTDAPVQDSLITGLCLREER